MRLSKMLSILLIGMISTTTVSGAHTLEQEQKHQQDLILTNEYKISQFDYNYEFVVADYKSEFEKSEFENALFAKNPIANYQNYFSHFKQPLDVGWFNNKDNINVNSICKIKDKIVYSPGYILYRYKCDSGKWYWATYCSGKVHVVPLYRTENGGATTIFPSPEPC